jgi:pyruvate dehydrogenase E1 component alpha subunit
MEKEKVIKMFEMAYTIRRFEEAAIEQYRLGHIYGYLHPYIGEEAIAVGAISALNPDDYIVSTHRGHGHALAKGHDLKKMFAELLGKANGYCGGRGGSMHVANLEQYNLGANGIVGGGIPIATGAGMAIKLRKTRQVVLSFFSDGAVNNGTFHESINLAAIYQLPVIYIIENNQYAVSTSVKESTRITDLSIRATSYGIPGLSMDGNDALVVHEVMQDPIKNARDGKGPALIEFKTYRYGGHHVNDPGLYMPREELEHWKSRDPVLILEKHLEDYGCRDEEIQSIKDGIKEKIKAAVQFALESPEPSESEFLKEIENS